MESEGHDCTIAKSRRWVPWVAPDAEKHRYFASLHPSDADVAICSLYHGGSPRQDAQRRDTERLGPARQKVEEIARKRSPVGHVGECVSGGSSVARGQEIPLIFVGKDTAMGWDQAGCIGRAGALAESRGRIAAGSRRGGRPRRTGHGGTCARRTRPMENG